MEREGILRRVARGSSREPRSMDGSRGGSAMNRSGGHYIRGETRESHLWNRSMTTFVLFYVIHPRPFSGRGQTNIFVGRSNSIWKFCMLLAFFGEPLDRTDLIEEAYGRCQI